MVSFISVRKLLKISPSNILLLPYSKAVAVPGCGHKYKYDICQFQIYFKHICEKSKAADVSGCEQWDKVEPPLDQQQDQDQDQRQDQHSTPKVSFFLQV